MRTIVLSLGFIALYPFLLRRYGVDVVGLWSLLALVAGIPQFVDVGFSQLMLRDARTDVPREEMLAVHRDYRAAGTCYAIALVVILVLVGAVGMAGIVESDTYSTAGVLSALTLLAVGIGFTLSASLDAAVLAARRDATFVQAARGAAPLISVAGAFTGAFVGYPIEGLAAGTATSQAALLTALRVRLRGHHEPWHALVTSSTFIERLIRSADMVRRGFHFYAASVGWGVRDALFRVFVGATMGLAAAAALDIAMRVGQTGRELIHPGFAALLPSFAAFSRSEQQEPILTLLRLAVGVLATGGALLFGSCIAMAPFLLPVWLGNVPAGAVNATIVLCVWQFTVVLLIPFWHLLQATGHERVASQSVWIHTCSILVLIPVGALIAVSLTVVCIFWTAASVVAQTVVYRVCDLRLHSLRPVAGDAVTAFVLGVTTAAVAACVAIAVVVDRSVTAALYLVVVQAPVVALVIVVVVPRVKRLVRDKEFGLVGTDLRPSSGGVGA